MARADSKLPRLAHSSASAIHVRLRSSSSTPTPMVARTMAAQVALAGGSDFSAASASLSHASRLITTPLSAKLFTPRAMILDTIASLPCASSSCGVLARVLFASFLFSPRRGVGPPPTRPRRRTAAGVAWARALAAVTQMDGSVGIVCRAALSTRLRARGGMRGAEGGGTESQGAGGVAGTGQRRCRGPRPWGVGPRGATRRAFSYVSSRARASHSSTCCPGDK